MSLNHKDFAFEIKAVQEDGFFSGYASVFGLVDGDQDVVLKGAFSASLASWSSKNRLPSLLWQHRQGEPIGVYTKMVEDEIGLYVEGRLALKTVRGAEAYELMKMQAVNGLSIGFVPRDDSYDRVTGVRSLKQVDLWEVSVVTFPANDASRVGNVKAQEVWRADECKALQSLINTLRGV